MSNPSPKQAYNFCVKCGARVVNKGSAFICANCGYNFYLPPALCNGMIIEDDAGRILLVQRARDPKKGQWDVPGGFVELGESFDLSVKREAKEELGVEVEMKDIVGVYHNRYLYQGIREWTMGIIVTAKIVSGELRAGDDAARFEFIERDEVLKRRIAFSSVKQALTEYLAGSYFKRVQK